MIEETTGLTRRDMLKVGGAATFAGYAVGMEKAFGQVVKTDTTGITAGDFEVKIGDYGMPVYEARPASGGPAPIDILPGAPDPKLLSILLAARLARTRGDEDLECYHDRIREAVSARIPRERACAWSLIRLQGRCSRHWLR